MSEAQRWCLEINKMDKPLARLRKKKRRYWNKIRNKREDIATDATEGQRLLRDHSDPLYANELDNLQEMDKFLETDLPLNQFCESPILFWTLIYLIIFLNPWNLHCPGFW